jgi:hypothetical protein
MKKKKRLTKISTAGSKGPVAAQEGVTSQNPFISAGSLLNKYNQKRPSGIRKLSPAADEEME